MTDSINDNAQQEKMMIEVARVLTKFRPYLIDIERHVRDLEFGEIELRLIVHQKRVESAEFVKRERFKYGNVSTRKKG